MKGLVVKGGYGSGIDEGQMFVSFSASSSFVGFFFPFWRVKNGKKEETN